MLGGDKKVASSVQEAVTVTVEVGFATEEECEVWGQSDGLSFKPTWGNMSLGLGLVGSHQT